MTRQILSKSRTRPDQEDNWNRRMDMPEILSQRFLISKELRLTPAEARVYELLIRGLQNKHIAHKLGISQSMVKTHVTSILRKTGATNRTEAVIVFMQHLIGCNLTDVLTDACREPRKRETDSLKEYDEPRKLDSQSS